MIFNIFKTAFFLSLLIQCSSTLQFQDNLFRKILEKNLNKNIMISPFSIYKVLSLILNGAIEDTQKEIFKALFPDKEIELDDTFLKQINSNINQILLNIESESNIDKSDNSKCKEDDCKITFKDVCGIFNKEGELKENFIKVCDNYNTFYDILISPEQINDFCSKNTEGKINYVIGKIDLLTVLMIINPIYFKGTWVNKFEQYSTTKRSFLNSDNTIVKVDTMYKNYEENVNLYYEDNRVQIIAIPYISNVLNFKMIIIKPN